MKEQRKTFTFVSNISFSIIIIFTLICGNLMANENLAIITQGCTYAAHILVGDNTLEIKKSVYSVKNNKEIKEFIGAQWWRYQQNSEYVILFFEEGMKSTVYSEKSIMMTDLIRCQVKTINGIKMIHLGEKIKVDEFFELLEISSKKHSK